MRLTFCLLICFVLSGCVQKPHVIDESWEVKLTPEGSGIYLLEGRFIERFREVSGNGEGTSSLEMPSIRFLQNEGGSAELGKDSHGFLTKVKVDKVKQGYAVNYYLEWFNDAKKRSTRGMLLLRE